MANILKKYQSFEARPCRTVVDAGQVSVEVCQPQDAQFWTVYGRYIDPDTGAMLADVLADCPQKSTAEVVKLCLTYFLNGD